MKLAWQLQSVMHWSVDTSIAFGSHSIAFVAFVVTDANVDAVIVGDVSFKNVDVSSRLSEVWVPEQKKVFRRCLKWELSLVPEFLSIKKIGDGEFCRNRGGWQKFYFFLLYKKSICSKFLKFLTQKIGRSHPFIGANNHWKHQWMASCSNDPRGR